MQHIKAIWMPSWLLLFSGSLIQSHVTHIGVELIIFSRQHHLFQVFTNARNSWKVYSVVVEAEQLMNHSLVCPLQHKHTTYPMTINVS